MDNHKDSSSPAYLGGGFSAGTDNDEITSSIEFNSSTLAVADPATDHTASNITSMGDALIASRVDTYEHTNRIFSDNAIKAVVLVVACHIALVMALHLLWHSSSLPLTITPPAAPKINAYTVTAAQLTQWQSTSLAEELPETETETHLSQQPVEEAQPSPSQSVATTAVEREATDQVLMPPALEVIVEAPSLPEALNEPQPSWMQTTAPAKNQYLFDIQQDRAATVSNDIVEHNVSSFTQSYITQQRNQALDTLVATQAEQYTATKTMSALTPDMLVLELPKIDYYDTALTLDNEMDPNRIVKIGDTCYRIAKVPTPLNPHAENIGFPFNCTGDKIKRAIQAAMTKRLQKMHHPAVKNH
ncbi:hypothetical protein [Shewanella waksmanii]|uniref:hypothetical protein n=1 Tax=Shewanella waksmanii TaxID=213783 RepID=UPI000492231A|nr:hypothetical protein [Shewanella waksmanii]